MVESTKNDEVPTEEQTAEVPKVKKNWADDEDENDSADEDRAIGGDGAVAAVPSNEPEKPKFIPPTRTKNARGDFVVTTINIKEKEVVKKFSDSEESSSEEESEEEPEKEEVEEKSKYRTAVTNHYHFCRARASQETEQEGTEGQGASRIRSTHGRSRNLRWC